jgi:hypothetical protein
MNFRQLAVGTAIVTLFAATQLRADPLLPGQVDFGSFSPPQGGEFIEVNLPSNLISLAAKFIEKHEPDVARLLNGLKLVRVNVIGLNEANRPEMEKRVQKVRTELSGQGWERIVTAQQQSQDIGVYLKMDAQSAIQGLTVTVIEGAKQAVFVNIVGEIRPEQLSMLGDRLHIHPLKELGLEAKDQPSKN